MPRIAPFARILRQTLSTPIAQPVSRITALTPPTFRTASASSSFSSLRLAPSARPSILARPLVNFSQPRSGPATQLQIRGLAYGNMYQPSQRKRKRKHGFLSRSKGGRLGRKTLARRWARGRRFLSH